MQSVINAYPNTTKKNNATKNITIPVINPMSLEEYVNPIEISKSHTVQVSISTYNKVFPRLIKYLIIVSIYL